MPHWTDIRGWLTRNEGESLRALARGKRVLELGSYCGRSTVCMAQVAASVTTIDNHCGIPENKDEPSEAELKYNIERFGLAHRVAPITGDIVEVTAGIPDGEFDLTFIDSDHSAESVERDARIALRVTKPSGTIAWHDGHMPSVQEGLSRAGLKPQCRADSLEWAAVKTVGNVFALDIPKVMIGMPYLDKVEVEANDAMQPGVSDTRINIAPSFFVTVPQDGRLKRRGGTTTAMNGLLCDALNRRDAGQATHYAEIHSDIIPFGPWLNILWGEMRKSGADAISAVIGIKDHPDQGRTSTAIGDANDLWVMRRYVYQSHRDSLPVTFGPKDVCNADECLLINTGLMLVDLRRPWWDEFRFEFVDRITRTKDGWKSWHRPEDWNMSRFLQKRGAKIRATWAAKAYHVGPGKWANFPECPCDEPKFKPPTTECPYQ